jgi:hypothetical protein
MYRLVVALCCLLFVLAGPSLAAALGAGIADSSFPFDSHPVARNATLSEGNQLETDAATPEPRLYFGERMRLATADGSVVALLRPGSPLEFAPLQVTDAQPPFEMSGCLERRQGRFVMRDLISGVVEEVRGNRLELEVGNTVQVTAKVVPGATPMEGATEVVEISRLRRISTGCASAAPGAEALKQGSSHRWNGYGFFAAGGSLAEIGGRFKGGGGGLEVFIWRGFSAGAEASAFQDDYYGTTRNLRHVGGNVSYHFAGREKTRGIDPFISFGGGRFFPGESRAVVDGGAGFNYWFNPHVAVRCEFRAGEWQYAEYTVGGFRAGITFR